MKLELVLKREKLKHLAPDGFRVLDPWDTFTIETFKFSLMSKQMREIPKSFIASSPYNLIIRSSSMYVSWLPLKFRAPGDAPEFEGWVNIGIDIPLAIGDKLVCVDANLNVPPRDCDPNTAQDIPPSLVKIGATLRSGYPFSKQVVSGQFVAYRRIEVALGKSYTPSFRNPLIKTCAHFCKPLPLP